MPVFWTTGRLRHQAALRLSFSRARAGIMYPCRWKIKLSESRSRRWSDSTGVPRAAHFSPADATARATQGAE